MAKSHGIVSSCSSNEVASICAIVDINSKSNVSSNDDDDEEDDNNSDKHTKSRRASLSVLLVFLPEITIIFFGFSMTFGCFLSTCFLTFLELLNVENVAFNFPILFLLLFVVVIRVFLCVCCSS